MYNRNDITFKNMGLDFSRKLLTVFVITLSADKKTVA